MATINPNFLTTTTTAATVSTAAITAANATTALVTDKSTLLYRDTQYVADVVINEAALGPIEAIYASPRVVTQTPKAGTLLARGTTVNLVFANGRSLITDAITGSYTGWKGEPLGKVYDDFLKDDTTMSVLVSKYAEDKTLSDAEQSQVTRVLISKGVEIGEGAGNDFNSVMVTLGAANTFNGIAI